MPTTGPLTAEEIAHYARAHAANEMDAREYREVFPRLLDEVERSRALLKRIEWNGTATYGSDNYPDFGTDGCPACGGARERGALVRQGHQPGCELAALIGTAPAEPQAPYTDALGTRIRFDRTNFVSGKPWKPGDRISLNGHQLILDADGVTFRALRPWEQ